MRYKKSSTQNYVNPVHRELPLCKAHAYLVGIGINWMVATTILGKYSLDKIRAGCLQLKNNSVNIAHREKYLLDYLSQGSVFDDVL